MPTQYDTDGIDEGRQIRDGKPQWPQWPQLWESVSSSVPDLKVVARLRETAYFADRLSQDLGIHTQPGNSSLALGATRLTAAMTVPPNARWQNPNTATASMA